MVLRQKRCLTQQEDQVCMPSCAYELHGAASATSVNATITPIDRRGGSLDVCELFNEYEV